MHLYLTSLLNLLTLTLISTLVSLFACYLHFAHIIDQYRDRICTDVRNLQTYDYIVVGAGSAGAVLSARIAEDGHKVLVIEAGGVAPPFLDIPLVTPMIQRSPYDWQRKTEPQHHSCGALIKNQSTWPMGKILGGSGRLNNMVHVRGHPADYKWFPDYTEQNPSKGGPIRLGDLKWCTNLADAILKAVEEMHQNVRNINEHLDTGFMSVQRSMVNGVRWSTDKFLLETNGNITILTHALVEKVLIKSNRATGVQFVRFNEKFYAMATKGVVLSAGTIGSPKILMLSGIGPKHHLKELKIEVINDLPVGEHLVDHILTGLDLVTVNVSLVSMATTFCPLSALQYFLYGEGPWTSSGIETLGTFHSSLQANQSAAPDLQLMVFPVGISKDNGILLKDNMGISNKVYEEYFRALTYENAISITPVLLHPKSTGHVRLRSADPSDSPIIDPRYLSDPRDVATMIDGLRFVKKLVETKPMKTLGAKMYEKHFPGCENEKFGSRDYWECYIRQLTLTSYHPAGTCRMGDVVDESFRVRGMRNLFVVDASILPVLPSGNINSPVIMLAEKAARVLKRERTILGNNEKCYVSQEYCDAFNIFRNKWIEV